jgi:osmotically-inducible protein OsmY
VSPRALQSWARRGRLLSRLFTLVVLAALLAGGYYLWRASPRSLSGFGDVQDAVEDAKTAASVKTALALSRSLKAAEIQVSVERGVATLRGSAGDERLRTRAEGVAAAVPGVRQVVNHLQVSGTAEPPAAGGRSFGESLDDQALAVQVRLALSLRRDLEGSDIQVAAFRREVTLRGELASSSQRETALETTRDVEGVARVVDELRLRDAKGGKGRGDALGAVRAALENNESLARYRLVADASGERIRLRGRVKSRAEKDLAGLLAERAAGSVSIENALDIVP